LTSVLGERGFDTCNIPKVPADLITRSVGRVEELGIPDIESSAVSYRYLARLWVMVPTCYRCQIVFPMRFR
jgi:hypothetical protein